MTRPFRAREWKRSAAVGFLGLVVESAAVRAGLYGYAGGWPTWWLALAWVVALWVLLGAALALWRLDGRPGLAACCGALGAPFVFAGGMKLGVVHFLVPPWLGLAVVAALWAGALPLALAVSRSAGRM